MNSKLKTEEMNQLFEAVLTLQSVDECYRFFEDICTVKEMVAMAQRLEVANMLRQKKTYVDITEKTGASTTTIGRVSRALNYGNDGYELVFERLNEKA